MLTKAISKTLGDQNDHNCFRADDTRSKTRQTVRDINVCVICGNSNEVVDLSANPIMRETMSSYCEDDDVDLDDCLSSVCINCVFKSRAVKEVQNKFKVRLKDLSNGHVFGANQNISDIKNGYYIEGPETEFKNQLDYRKNDLSDCQNIQNVQSFTSNSPQRLELLTILNNPSSLASSCSNSTHSPNGWSHPMLQVIRERPESVLITESGGKINNYKTSRRSQKQKLCQYCGNSYVRKDHYNKHVRRCRNFSSRTLPLLSATNAKNLQTNSVDKYVIPTAIVSPIKRTRQFHCTQCPTKTNNITQLRLHRTTHLREYKCNLCTKGFSTFHEHDFHRTICLAQWQAQQEQEDNENQEEQRLNNGNISTAKSERTITFRRVTRAQSRARTVIAANPATKRRLTLVSSVSQYVYSDDGDENSDNAYSNSDEDGLSVADSFYSKRRIYIADWLDKPHLSDHNEMPAIHISSGREYDLLLLEKLKAQIKSQEFICLVEKCNFYADTLPDLMLHDYLHHFKASWFYCQKCGGVFTSKVFLDYHLDRQNDGRFICYKCNEQFMFQNQLDSHLILHKKRLNHPCSECRCEFLSNEKLYQHARLEHCNQSQNNLIRIQSKSTFASVYSSSGNNEYLNSTEHAKYTVRIVNMNLPCMPSKRPLELPGHKPYRRHIGNIRFEDEKNFNCCSCK